MTSQQSHQTHFDDTQPSGWRALVLRPQPDNQTFCDLVTQHGGEACSLPTTEIVCHTASPHVLDLGAIHSSTWIFTSAWAVKCLSQHAPVWSQLPQADVFAIGPKTQQALRSAHVVSALPQRHHGHFTSEQLLADDHWQTPNNHPLFIAKGQGGRQTLQHKLSQLGWHVTPLDLYVRRALPIDEAAFNHWLTRGQMGQTVVFATSMEVLNNLLHSLSTQTQAWLIQCPIIVLSTRMEKAVKQLGWSGRIEISAMPDPQSQLQAAFTCLQQPHPTSHLT